MGMPGRALRLPPGFWGPPGVQSVVQLFRVSTRLSGGEFNQLFRVFMCSFVGVKQLFRVSTSWFEVARRSNELVHDSLVLEVKHHHLPPGPNLGRGDDPNGSLLVF